MKINIIGKGDGWESAPLENSWGATQLILRRPVSMVVDMNDYSNNRWGVEESLEAEASKSEAKRLGIPYIGLHNYPLQEVIEFFGDDYFSNTIDYMIALAIYKGATEIDIYGVNMLGDQYLFEKPGVEYWRGQAMGRGIKVTVHGKQSLVGKTPDGLLYGYDVPQPSLARRN